MSGQMPLFGTTDSKPSKRVAARVEEIVGEGFDVKKFVENFELLVDATAGVEKLRGLVLHMAVQGRLLKEASMSTENTPKSEGLSVPFGLPEGWMWRRVDEVGDLKLGRQRSPKNHSGPNMRPYLRVANVFEARIDTSDVLEMNFDPVEAERFLLAPNDVLLNEGQSYELVGRPAIYRGEVPGACFQNTLIRFRPSQFVLPEFALTVFRAYMRTGRFRREAQQTTNIAHLSLGRLAEIEFPLPPLAEQKRIVAKVDQLMALCDDLEARQTKKREIGTRLTKSALEALTTAEGPEEFDAAWKRVVENFDVLIDRTEKLTDLRRHLLQLAVTGALSPSGASTWKQGRIADVADCRLGKMLDKAKNRGTPLPYLRNTNVHWFRLELGDIKHMLFEDNELEEYELRAGDLVVCEGGHGIGRTAVWKGDLRPMMFQKALHRLRPRPTMNSDFLAYQIKVASDTGVMNRYFTGTGIPHLTGRRLAEMEVTIPPFEEQRRIVARVERLMNVCSDLEAQLRRTEDRAGKLAEAVVQALVT